jgi:hypothetical protein
LKEVSGAAGRNGTRDNTPTLTVRVYPCGANLRNLA